MFKQTFRTFLLAGWLIFVYIFTGPLSIPSRIDLLGRDFATRLRTRYATLPKEIDRIVIVTLDDETYRVSGQRLPFPRWLHAQAIDGFMSVQPLAVAYDFVFGGAGYTAEEDETFKQSLKKAHRIVLASLVGSDFKEHGPSEDFLSDTVVKGPINKYPTVDGVLRAGLPYFLDKETGAQTWSWEFATLFQAGLVKPEEVSLHSNVLWARPLEEKGFQVPVNAHSFYYFNYFAKPEQFTAVPFWRFLTRELPEMNFKDKIFIVGNTAKLSHDKHPTPYGEIDGAFINANVILTLLTKRFLYQIPALWQGLALLTGLLLVLWAGFTKRIVHMTVFALSGAAIYIAVSIWAIWYDVIFDLYYEAGYLILVWFVFAVYRQVTMAVETITLREEAIHDPLTGFFTRRYLAVRLKYDLEKLGSPSVTAKRKGIAGSFALAMVDLDNFKLVNDTFGHAEGDRTLKTVAEVIRKHVRREDIVCRYGGDEFCIIMAGTDAEGGAALLERVREGIVNDDRLSYTTKGNVKSIRVTASFGVASAKWSPDLTEIALIKIADRALYEAKKGGRNRIVIASETAYEEGIKEGKAEKLAEKNPTTQPADEDPAPKE